nr:hypothetical protein GCM10020092_029580 [Actinoplanes digitatis]
MLSQPDGDGADRLHVDQVGLAAEAPDLLDHAGGVGDGRRVGHREDRRVAAERGGARAGLDGLGVLAAGLAQVGVQVDEAGERDEALGVDHLGAVGGPLGDHPVGDQQIGRVTAEKTDTLDQVRGHALPPSSR